jgi:hypothetical protein
MYNKLYPLSIQDTQVLNTVGDRWTVLQGFKNELQYFKIPTAQQMELIKETVLHSSKHFSLTL